MTIQLHRQTEVAVNRHGVIGRRDFLRGITAAGIAAGTLSWADLMSVEAAELRSRGMACILLWMQGGPSQFETFDPKPGHANGGETKAISTAASGVQIAENFPKLAKMMKDVALIRSMTSKEGSHPRASYLLHTGYLPAGGVQFPALGSIAAQQIADPQCELPSFVRVGAGVKNGSDGGLLGVQYDPFTLTNPQAPPTNTQPATDVARYQRRLGLLDKLETGYAAQAPQEVADHKKLYDRASRMILSSQMKAFDLAAEPEKIREGYGQTQFGAGCLLARRLVESGVTFVEVALNGWDTHQDNFTKVKELTGQVDQPFAYLLQDLKSRGLLDTTLVVWMGEFGRTPRINPRAGRDHYPRAFNVALAGGGVRGGQAIGETNPAGAEVSRRPVTVPDLFQSFCKSLKIDAKYENISPNGRPIKIVDEGAAVDELFTG